MPSDHHDAHADQPCCSGRCQGSSQPPDLARRSFLKLTGLGAAMLASTGRMPVMAGPFDDVNDYLRLIPEDKKLSPEWLASLTARGQKQVYRDPTALEHVGMPVGGLFAGTVYLAGDGRLWLWDIFNRDQEGIQPRQIPYKGENVPTRNGANYLEPAAPVSPFDQGFSLRVGNSWRTLDAKGFERITFDGRYPMGRVTYEGGDSPVRVALEAFSPFIPLDVENSSYPAVLMSYTITNTSSEKISGEIRGRIANPVGLDSVHEVEGRRRNRVLREPGVTLIACSAEAVEAAAESPRPDILFADFESDRFEGWTAEGTAFGTGPVVIAEIPDYQGDVQGKGLRVINSHASAPAGDVGGRDAHTGTLTSRAFTIDRRFISFLIGGGAHKGKTCIELLVEGEVVAATTGRDDNRMQPASWNVSRWEGRIGRLRNADRESGPWGNIGIDHIVFTDTPPTAVRPFAERPDFGTMALALCHEGSVDADAAASLADPTAAWPGTPVEEAHGPLGGSLMGVVGRSFTLEPGKSTTATFVLAWHFPNFHGRGLGGRKVGHEYATRFDSAAAVARQVADHLDHLAGTTRRWVETWYDATLPYWFLDRTMANTSTLATTTCYRFADGRFWAWEGIGCCEGTCTHVWHYAQAAGRLFPEIERITRERVDFGLAQHGDGGIGMRAGLGGANEPAHDGQCGRILGAYREHLMSRDDAFLKRLWPRVRKAIAYLIDRDGNADGLIEGAQPNTLDAAWYGKISSLASLYLAALQAGAAMADEIGDVEFARQCRTIAERGSRTILDLYDGEYFIQIEDPAHLDAIGVGPGCHIDQVFGQTWAHWLGLGHLFDAEKQRSALRALYRYNFVPDVGPFREHFTRGRWYATAGDAGLLMCTWPKGGENPNYATHWQYMYFNECMSGFEWQAAAHMIHEGQDDPELLRDGLAVARAIHDRYDAALRNPYNEVECSDHYARAMASYGAYQAICGFQCHGPKGHLSFAPRLTPDDFAAAFVAPEGWGRYTQSRNTNGMTASIRLDHGNLRLASLTIVPREDAEIGKAVVRVDGRNLAVAVDRQGKGVTLSFAEPITPAQGQTIEIELA